MARAASRTPIDPRLVHDPARDALDAAKLDEITGFVPIDTAQRCLREARERTRRNDLREFVRHPLRTLHFLCVELPMWLLYALIHFERRRGPATPPPSDLAFVRRQVALTWTEALLFAVDRTSGSMGAALPLSATLFPPFVRDEFTGCTSWCDVLVHQATGLLDETAATELLEAFAIQMRARIDVAPGQLLDLPWGIRVVRHGEGYVAVTT